LVVDLVGAGGRYVHVGRGGVLGCPGAR
jgi:hypothetical protein